MTKEGLKIVAERDTLGRSGAERVLKGCNFFLWKVGCEKNGIEFYTKEGERCARTLNFLCSQRYA